MEFAILKNTVFVFFWEPTQTGDRICFFILQQKLQLHEEQKFSMKKKSFFLETWSSQNMLRLLEGMTCKFFGSCSFWGLIFFFFWPTQFLSVWNILSLFERETNFFLLLVGCVFKIVTFLKNAKTKKDTDWPVSKRTQSIMNALQFTKTKNDFFLTVYCCDS